MSRILDALGWSGSGYTVSLFMVTESPTPPSLRFEIGVVRPSSVRTHLLADEESVLGGLYTYEYDLAFEVLPRELHPYLEECLRRVCGSGARLAWFEFEGSFSFGYLLADEVADQIYGVCAMGCEPTIVLDDEALTSASWKAELGSLRRCLR